MVHFQKIQHSFKFQNKYFTSIFLVFTLCYTFIENILCVGIGKTLKHKYTILLISLETYLFLFLITIKTSLSNKYAKSINIQYM